MYFSTENALHGWSPPEVRGDSILVVPPTHAAARMFDAQHWLEQTLSEIKRHTARSITVRMKPTEPHVDEYGELAGMVANKSS